MPSGHHDADQQCHQADEIVHTLLTALHDGTRQSGRHHGQRTIVDRVEPQLAFDVRVGAPHDATPVGRAQDFRLLRDQRAVVERREVQVLLCVGADAGDFRRSDAAREYQGAGRGPAAVAVQDSVCGDDVRHTIDEHQPQRALLVEHGAHERREPIDLGDRPLTGGMRVTGVVGVVLERRDQFLFRVQQPDEVDVHFVEPGLREVLVFEVGIERRHVRVHVVPARVIARGGFDLGVLRDQRLAHDLDAARNLVLLDVFELAQDEVTGSGPGSKNEQCGG
jgi:hypothetical protein